MHALFWIGFGIILHDFAHALWQAGGVKEVLSFQGGYIGLGLIAASWVIATELDLRANFEPGPSSLLENAKGTLAIVGVALIKGGWELAKTSFDQGMMMLLVGLVFIITFALWLDQQLNEWKSWVRD